MSRGPAEFWVLVPATPTTHLVNDFNALSCAFPVDPAVLPGAADVQTRDQGIAEAQSNLDTELHRLRQIGATADGAVGDPDPMKAIEKTLNQRQFDEIIFFNDSSAPSTPAAAEYLPLARLGPPTSCPSENQRSADRHKPHPGGARPGSAAGVDNQSDYQGAPWGISPIRRAQ